MPTRCRRPWAGTGSFVPDSARAPCAWWSRSGTRPRRRAVGDIEFLDNRGELIARLDSYECVVDASLSQAFRRNQLIAPSPVTAS